jgi:C4-dicarboxylate transporter
VSLIVAAVVVVVLTVMPTIVIVVFVIAGIIMTQSRHGEVEVWLISFLMAWNVKEFNSYHGTMKYLSLCR